MRLERYERRTSSRQKRAICEFVNSKLMRRMGGIAGSPTEANIAADCEG
jgi:hypothetical protein